MGRIVLTYLQRHSPSPPPGILGLSDLLCQAHHVSQSVSGPLHASPNRPAGGHFFMYSLCARVCLRDLASLLRFTACFAPALGRAHAGRFQH